ncbi:MAG: hypothetical protein AAF723_10545, partial [Pseudomonadota bacterium]
MARYKEAKKVSALLAKVSTAFTAAVLDPKGKTIDVALANEAAEQALTYNFLSYHEAGIANQIDATLAMAPSLREVMSQEDPRSCEEIIDDHLRICRDQLVGVLGEAGYVRLVVPALEAVDDLCLLMSGGGHGAQSWIRNSYQIIESYYHGIRGMGEDFAEVADRMFCRYLDQRLADHPENLDILPISGQDSDKTSYPPPPQSPRP